jgi:two-component system sensor histidine kinase AlgZ
LQKQAFRLPDFRNQGIWLRCLLAANGLMLGVALIRNGELAQLPREIVELAAVVEPALLLTLAGLFMLAARLQAMAGPWAALLAICIAMSAMAGVDILLAQVVGSGTGWRAPAAAGLGMLAILFGFDVRARAQVPALAEARLSALTARIRPHFLFNSLNAVLGIIRDDPRRAEATLEELADLFRALMRENSDLTLLSEEIALARKYLDIEKLRLGERLQVRWEVDACPADMLAPPLLLQPLLENAVYHGIEPAAQAGEIRVHIAAHRDGVRIEIDNPVAAERGQRHGNRMALDNLRERLMLFYDLEARLDAGIDGDRYRVRIELPERRHG